jgi:hypothetical protein
MLISSRLIDIFGTRTFERWKINFVLKKIENRCYKTVRVHRYVSGKDYLNAAGSPVELNLLKILYKIITFILNKPETDVMILKIFSPKNLAKILAFFAQTTASFCKNLILTLVFEKNANFLLKNGKNRRKLICELFKCRNSDC